MKRRKYKASRLAVTIYSIHVKLKKNKKRYGKMEPFVIQNKSILTIENWMNQFPELVAGITTRNGGYSKGIYRELNLGFHVGDDAQDVCANRIKTADLLDFSLNRWIGAEQIHDCIIQKVTKDDCGKGAISYTDAFKGTDGFYTDESGILLTLCFADCVPLFFIAPEKKMIGTAHAGWKGTVKTIAKQMVETWRNEGIHPEQIFVTIGPSICGKCYIVNDYVINFVKNLLEEVEEKPYNLIKEGQYSLDLREMNRLILRKAGVPDQNITMTSYCSSCNEQFFSHRRDQGQTGRMLSFIGWKETAFSL
jgi:YfiH family protein